MTNGSATEPAAVAIVGIGELLTMDGSAGDPLGIVRDAALLLREGRVVWAGPQRDLPSVARGDEARIDAGGRLATPGLVEPHAHPIFAGSRAAEFDLRAQGRSYLEIQAAGGGILATVRATRAASDDELCASTAARLDGLLAHGVTVCEAKSGYALDLDGELRLLRLLARVNASHAVDLAPTLLAHVPPPECATAGDRAAFVARFADELVPRAAADGDGAPLAEALDVYCDRGAFTLDETRRLLEAGARARLRLRVHAEQFTHTGAAALAAELRAASVEHLEELADEDVPKLAAAGVVCTLLPGAALTLRLRFPNARRLLDAGCEVALGTDCNPGSSLTENLPLMMSLGCMQMGMSCAEAWRAVTLAPARALGRADSGHLTVGARADVVLWNTSDHREVPQHYGVPLASHVFIRGQLVIPDSSPSPSPSPSPRE